MKSYMNFCTWFRTQSKRRKRKCFTFAHKNFIYAFLLQIIPFLDFSLPFNILFYFPYKNM